MIKLEQVFEGHYKAFWSNGSYLGDVDREVDGYFVWWPQGDRGGFHSEHFLRAMADCLHQLNLEWHKQVREELGEDAEATVEE